MGVYMKENGQLKKGAGLYKVSVPVGLADIYSLDERIIGCYIDGKPLYQKSIQLDDVTVPQSGRTIISLSNYISNIDTIVNAEAVTIDTNLTIPAFQIATLSQYGMSFYVNKTDGIVISRGSDSGTVTRDFLVTIKYTKTTDVPWSGIVPQGYGYVSSGDIYSTQERQVGVWTDGKPLYQKTVDCGALPANTTKNVAHGITDIDRIVSVRGCAFRSVSGNETGIPIPSTHYQTIGNQNEISVNFTNVVLRNGNSSASAFDKTQVTIQYTKTTDVAGSGEYVPSGDRAKHYTADEHIIGTWTDGSTLYEKTVRVAANATGTITLWTDASVVVKDYDGRFVFRSSENALSLYSRLSDAAYRAELSGIGNSTTYGVYADITLGTSRTNALDIELTVRYIKASS